MNHMDSAKKNEDLTIKNRLDIWHDVSWEVDLMFHGFIDHGEPIKSDHLMGWSSDNSEVFNGIIC